MAAFVDTNILIYAFADTSGESHDKVLVSRSLITGLFERNELIVSAQVLSEFSVAALRKLRPPLGMDQVAERIAELSTQKVIPIDASLVQLALQRTQQSRISYWDALIVEAAIRSGATTLYTERHASWHSLRRASTPQSICLVTTRMSLSFDPHQSGPLIQIVTTAMADVTLRSGDWLKCRPDVRSAALACSDWLAGCGPSARWVDHADSIRP